MRSFVIAHVDFDGQLTLKKLHAKDEYAAVYGHLRGIYTKIDEESPGCGYWDEVKKELDAIPDDFEGVQELLAHWDQAIDVIEITAEDMP